MKRLFLALALITTATAGAQTLRITEKPETLVHGTLNVPVVASDPVERIVFTINGVKYTEAIGKQAVAQVRVGQYIRRMRIRATGLDAGGNVVAEDEMVVNDPQPPFRIHLSAPNAIPETGLVTLSANITRPAGLQIRGVDFFVGEEKIGSATVAPYVFALDAARMKDAVYARAVARTNTDAEANDVVFFGDRVTESVDVSLQQVPLSVAAGSKPLRLEDLTLLDNGEPRRIEALVPASDQPLNVILLIDYSESMLEELPVVKEAARQFARALLRPQDRIAVVGFNQRTYWLTNWTSDANEAAAVVDRMKPIGETHLYDSVMEMLFEIQKRPGRRALVVLTDGVDQGSAFNLDHLVWYARYAGVPVYPVVKNRMLSKLMRFGVGQLKARQLRQVAQDTGATPFIIQKEKELPAVYQRISDELRRQYQLVFYSSPGAEDQWHPLKVETRGGQQLRVPRGYFP